MVFLLLSENSYRVSLSPKLHREFRKAVKQLPKIYSPEYKQQFYKLIDNFGTHYLSKVNQNDGVVVTKQNAILSHLTHFPMCVKIYHSR